jgi:hypothetical protein
VDATKERQGVKVLPNQKLFFYWLKRVDRIDDWCYNVDSKEKESESNDGFG